MKQNANKIVPQLDDNLAFQIDYTANYNKSFRREFQAQFIGGCETPDEFTILYALHLHPDISQSELAKFLFKGKAHIGKILNEMEERGLIKRIADTRDNIIIELPCNILLKDAFDLEPSSNSTVASLKIL